jgi:hypothetical protein
MKTAPLDIFRGILIYLLNVYVGMKTIKHLNPQLSIIARMAYVYEGEQE